MKIILPNDIQTDLYNSLLLAGKKEIGGILLGEHVGYNTFKVVEITIQSEGGTWIRFIRKIENAIKAIRKYFERTGHDYKRFNYLGEWHSHPSFSPNPSNQDINSMLEIINDKKVGANFIVLMIVKLNNNNIEGSVKFFTKDNQIISGQLIFEPTYNLYEER